MNDLMGRSVTCIMLNFRKWFKKERRMVEMGYKSRREDGKQDLIDQCKQ
jgi:hypothetical protein